jgi:hypothetical protein
MNRSEGDPWGARSSLDNGFLFFDWHAQRVCTQAVLGKSSIFHY